jgi:hypothetical protein
MTSCAAAAIELIRTALVAADQLDPRVRCVDRGPEGNAMMAAWEASHGRG